MYLPRMIYKGGILSPKPADYCIVKDLDELMAKVGDGFLPLGCESVEGMKDIPELKALIDKSAQKTKREQLTLEMAGKITDILEKPEPIKKRRARRVKNGN